MPGAGGHGDGGLLVDRKALAEFGAMLGRHHGPDGAGHLRRGRESVQHQLPQQLGRCCSTKLGLPHGKKTKTGWSTNAEVLEKLRYD